MNTEFWLAKWHRNEIGFHMQHPHDGLVQYFSATHVPAGSYVFVPLCGKTLDIQWMVEKGYRVVGVEISQVAVEQLFAELGMQPVISFLSPNVTVFEGGAVRIFVADIFALDASIIGPVDVVYDRAALVALPEDMRLRYAQHLVEMTKGATQFLICVEYDQARLSGPPFAVMEQDVRQYYAQYYDIRSIDKQPVANGIKGREPGYEHIWLLRSLDV